MTVMTVNVAAPAAVPVARLHQRLGWAAPCRPHPASQGKRLIDWRMEEDDAPLFRHLYRQHRPRRHLEFGTWQGQGVLYCLQECDAAVWTLNLPDGEQTAEGQWCYYSDFAADAALPRGIHSRLSRSGRVVAQTDAGAFIGRLYREAGLGHRVCQVYCDSTQWDTRAYPPGFFDSVLIDGGHDRTVVVSDTRKALPLLRSGGLLLWHDYCPDPEVLARCSSTQGVHAALADLAAELAGQLSDLFWIQPSWILLGVKR